MIVSNSENYLGAYGQTLEAFEAPAAVTGTAADPAAVLAALLSFRNPGRYFDRFNLVQNCWKNAAGWPIRSATIFC